MPPTSVDPIRTSPRTCVTSARAALAAVVTMSGTRGRHVRRSRRWAPRPIIRTGNERGMSTAEYAVGTVAACGFAALLFKIVTSDQVRSMLTDIIERALQLTG